MKIKLSAITKRRTYCSQLFRSIERLTIVNWRLSDNQPKNLPHATLQPVVEQNCEHNQTQQSDLTDMNAQDSKKHMMTLIPHDHLNVVAAEVANRV